MSGLPAGTVMFRVDYGEPDWREPAPGETPGARADCGYADITTDGVGVWIKFGGQHEIEMTAKGARIIAGALISMADLIDKGAG